MQYEKEFALAKVNEQKALVALEQAKNDELQIVRDTLAERLMILEAGGKALLDIEARYAAARAQAASSFGFASKSGGTVKKGTSTKGSGKQIGGGSSSSSTSTTTNNHNPNVNVTINGAKRPISIAKEIKKIIQ